MESLFDPALYRFRRLGLSSLERSVLVRTCWGSASCSLPLPLYRGHSPPVSVGVLLAASGFAGGLGSVGFGVRQKSSADLLSVSWTFCLPSPTCDSFVKEPPPPLASRLGPPAFPRLPILPSYTYIVGHFG